MLKCYIFKFNTYIHICVDDGRMVRFFSRPTAAATLHYKTGTLAAGRVLSIHTHHKPLRIFWQGALGFLFRQLSLDQPFVLVSVYCRSAIPDKEKSPFVLGSVYSFCRFMILEERFVGLAVIFVGILSS